MDFRILGPLEVVRDGEPLALGGAKQRAVLAVLLLRANETVSLDRLIDELWGAHPPPGAVQSVRVRISRLRKVLEADPGGTPTVLVTTAGGYELRVDGGDFDRDRFERLVAEGRRVLAGEQPERAAELLREALGLWRGPALADVAYEPFAQAEAARLEELRVEAIEARIEAEMEVGQHAEVVAELDPLVAEHPLRERLRWLQMLALYRCGRQAEALETYRDARRTLVEEIGAEPGAELRELHEAILRQDSSIAAPAIVRGPPAPPAPGEPLPDAEPGAGGRPGPRWRELAALALAVGLAVVALVLVLGDDESVAVSENAVALIDPEGGEVTAQVAVGRGPIAATADSGTVWVANETDGTASRVDAETLEAAPLDVGGQPAGLALGAGSLWVANAEDRRVTQIDLETNRALREIEVGNGPRGIVVAFGAAWVTASVDGMVTRFDLSEGRVERIPVGANPTAIVAGGGSIWVANEDSATVIRIDPDAESLRPVNVGNGPASLAFGQGALWVANREDGTVSRIDPESSAVTETVRVGAEPSAVAAGEGAVWVANAGDGTVSRIDPETVELADTVELGGSPSALALQDGAVWAAALAAPESHRGGTLRLTWSPPDQSSCACTDPIDYLNLQSYEFASLAYDGLIAYRRGAGPATATLVGNLATEVPEPSPDGKTYVFELRAGPTYSNGVPVRPGDFRSSLERLLRVNGRRFPRYFNGIPGARRCVTEPRNCDLSRGIETDAESRTITVHLRSPDPDFLHKLTLPVASVVPANSPLDFARERPLPGTGPYRIASFDPQQGGRLVRNPHFEVWSEDARPDGYPDEITIEIANDIDAQVAAVRRGAADMVVVSDAFGGPLPPAEVRELAIRDPDQLHSTPVPETDFMFLDVTLPPFDDVRVRRAFNHAVDRRRVVALAGGNQLAQPTCQVIPPGFPGYRPYCPYALDPGPGAWGGADLAEAQRLVEASGTRGAKVTLWGWPERERIVRYLASVLRQLGYRSSVRIVGLGPFFESITDPDSRIQASYNGWYADYLAPSNFVEPLFGCPASFNQSRFCDPAIEAQMDRALARQGAGSLGSNLLWERVDRRLTDLAPALPLLNRKAAVFVSERVGNVEHAPQSGVLADQLWVR